MLGLSGDSRPASSCGRLSGKLGALGKRPRFRFTTRQRRITSYLPEIDAALAAAGKDRAWLHRKARNAPLSPPDTDRAHGGAWEGQHSGRQLLNRAEGGQALLARRRPVGRAPFGSSGAPQFSGRLDVAEGASVGSRLPAGIVGARLARCADEEQAHEATRCPDDVGGPITALDMPVSSPPCCAAAVTGSDVRRYHAATSGASRTARESVSLVP